MKKQLILGCLLVLALASASTSFAAGIEELLKEKGVITAAEYQELVRQKPAAYIPGKGLSAETADGNYSLQIGGYAQWIYRFTDFEATSVDDKSDFDIRRFKLMLKGNVINKQLGYRFSGDISSGFRTEDAYLSYKVAAPLTLQFGQFKPAQARQELTSAAKQLFPERSLANDTFNLGRDQGLQASGSFADKMLAYRIGIFNGNGPNIGNPDNHHMVSGRFDLDPLGAYAYDEAGWTSDRLLLTLGASGTWNEVGANDVGNKFGTDNDVMDVTLGLDDLTAAEFTAAYGDELTWLLWTSNLNARWLGATFAAEYYHLNADPDLGADWNADGYYVQAGYQLIPNTLEVAARYSEVTSDEANAAVTFDKAHTQFGINYYLQKHNAKLQADYTQIEDQLAAGKDDQIFRLQAQLYY